MPRFAITVLLLAIGGPTAWGVDEPALTLGGAIDMALAANPAHRSRRLDTGKAEAQQQAARGARLPTLDLSASATRHGYPSLVYPIREIGVFPPLDDTIYDYGVALRLPLYAGGRLSRGVTVADLGKQIALERERLGTQELTYNVSAVYMKIQQLSALGLAYDARIASLEAQEQRVRLLVQVGRAPRLDLLKIGVQLGKARHDRLKVLNGRRQACTLLYNLMGREPPSVQPPLITYSVTHGRTWDLAALQRSARELRPELSIAERNVAVGVAQADIARASRLPDVALVGAYRERAGADTDVFDDWNLSLQLSMPLFDGGVRRSRVEQAVLAEQQARQEAEQQRLDVDKQVQDAWDVFEESRSRVAVTGDSVRESDEALAIDKLRYQQGVGTVTDLLGAETALLSAQADRSQAEFDLIMAHLGLLRASGQLDPESVLTLVRAESDTVTEEYRP